MVVDQNRIHLKFVNNAFEEVVIAPPSDFSAWEMAKRNKIRSVLGSSTTLVHYTLDILSETPSDSVGLRERRKTIPRWVFSTFES
jgi:hypothetical protein